MKTFSQFLNELYLSEEEADQLRLLKRDNKKVYNFKKNIGNKGISVDPTPNPASRRISNSTPELRKESPGQQVIRKVSKIPTTKALIPGKRGGYLTTRTINLQSPPESMMQGAYDIANKPPKNTSKTSSVTKKSPFKVDPQTSIPSTTARKSAAREKLAKASAGMGPSGNTIITPPPADSTPLKPNANISNKQKIKSRLGRIVGPGFAALDTALSAADERSKGSGWARSLAKGATVAAGGALGGTLGAIGGGGLGSAALGIAGATAGGAAAEKAFDVAAGANARERAAMMRANRMRQSGSSLKGIGGSTTFSQKKPGGPAFMSTGAGSQRRTVQLAKTGEVHRGGQSVAGHLAFKGGKAVYKAGPSAQSLAKTSSNPLERIGRSLFAGAYKKHDAAKAQQALQKARQNDAARNKKLGVKALPGK